MNKLDLYTDIDFDLENLDNEIKKNNTFDTKLRDLCIQKSEEAKKSIFKPIKDTSFDNFVIVTGLPIVDKEKSLKLKVLFEKKIFVQYDLLKKFKDIKFEFNDFELGTGTAIVEFSDAEIAIQATEKLNSIIIPPNYKLSVMTFNQFE